MLFALAVVIAYSPLIIEAHYPTAIYRPEALALGELDDNAARPRPCAGFEALFCTAECPHRPARGHRIHRRIARKLTWV